MRFMLTAYVVTLGLPEAYKQRAHPIRQENAGTKKARRMFVRRALRLKKEAAYLTGFQAFTKSMHWVISGTLVSQLCSYSQCSGPG